MSTTVGSLGMLLKVWRMQAGLGVDEMADLLAQAIGDDEPVSRGTVSRYEVDDFPKGGPKPLVLAAWAFASGRGLSEFPEDVRYEVLGKGERVSKVYDRIRSRWGTTSAPLSA